MISIFESKNILGLQELAPEELVDKIFGSSKSLKLSKAEFKELFKKNFPHVLKEKAEVVDQALEKVFGVCDKDRDGFLDVDELGKGTGVFTSKRLMKNPTRDLFYFLDKNLRTLISDKEVKEFVAGLSNKGVRDLNLNVDIQGLFADIHRNNPNNKQNDTTYWQLYRFRNLDQVKKLEALFVSTNSQTTTMKPSDKSSFTQTLPDQSNGFETERKQSLAQSLISVKSAKDPIVINSFEEFMELARITGIATINSKELVNLLKSELTEKFSLTLDQFVHMFSEVFKGKYKNYYQFKEQLTAIFNYLDGNGNGVLDVDEIMHGFIHMGAGNERDKIEAAFMIIDRDGSGFVDYLELFYYFKQMFLVAVPNDQGLSQEKFEQEIDELASATATDVFKTVDVNGDEKVSLEEFIYWYEHDGGNPAAFEAAKKKSSERKKVLDQAQKEPKSLYDIQRELSTQNAYTASVEELRKLLPFDKVNIEDAIKVYKKEFDMEFMPLPQFIKFIDRVFKVSGLDISNKSVIKEAAGKVFSVIDHNSNGTLDINELATGLSLICGGTSIEKMRAAFVLHDRDNSNNLDLEELVSYMETIFRIVGHQNNNESIQKTNPEELARLTAIQCFKECGVPLEGALSYDNFREWFIA